MGFPPRVLTFNDIAQGNQLLKASQSLSLLGVGVILAATLVLGIRPDGANVQVTNFGSNGFKL